MGIRRVAQSSCPAGVCIKHKCGYLLNGSMCQVTPGSVCGREEGKISTFESRHIHWLVGVGESGACSACHVHLLCFCFEQWVSTSHGELCFVLTAVSVLKHG